jgi:hypothetical protein
MDSCCFASGVHSAKVVGSEQKTGTAAVPRISFSASFEWSMRLGAAYAQTSRGTVTGTVLDSSGATRGVDMADTGDKIAGPTS